MRPITRGAPLAPAFVGAVTVQAAEATSLVDFTTLVEAGVALLAHGPAGAFLEIWTETLATAKGLGDRTCFGTGFPCALLALGLPAGRSPAFCAPAGLFAALAATLLALDARLGGWMRGDVSERPVGITFLHYLVDDHTKG